MTTFRRSSSLLIVAGTAALVACGPGTANLPPEEAVTVPGEGTVVVFVEAPRRIAGPVLKTFEQQTGIQVNATYRENLGDRFLPSLKEQAARGAVDLFWAETPLSAYDVADARLAAPFRPIGARPVPSQYRDREFRWIGFSANPRVIVYNNNALKQEDAPTETTDLVREPWAGKGAMPRIASGPAAFHAAALFALWGPERARAFFDALRAGGTRIVEDDLAARQLVASGQAQWSVIGLDQGICAKREGEPLNIVFPDRLGAGTVVPPHAAVLLRGAPHPAQAKGLFGYLFATETGWILGKNDCALVSLLPDIPKPEWVPTLAAFNIASIDPDRVRDSYRENASYLASWGAGGAPAPTPAGQPSAALPRP